MNSYQTNNLLIRFVSMTQHYGIDYGSKMAGTTVICRFDGEKFELLQSAKNQDADRFLLDHCRHKTSEIYIDAPLSLPGVYRGLPGCSDYFYRKADKVVRAMSPMFLGGLTARAIQLQAQLGPGIRCKEVYPGALARSLQLEQVSYKNKVDDINRCQSAINEKLNFPTTIQAAIVALRCNNWHQLDALLAWCIGWKVQQQSASVAGEATEGLLYY